MVIDLEKYFEEKISDLKASFAIHKQDTKDALELARGVEGPRLEQIEKEMQDLQLSRAELRGKASQVSFLISISLSIIAMLGMLCGLSINIILAIRLFLQ